jgi:hypothetical protein
MKATHSFILRGSILGLLASCAINVQADSPSITLEPIGTAVASSLPLPDSSPSEIVAHDPETQRLFVVNANAAKLDVFNISTPTKPKLLNTIDIKPFGSVANSVAIRDGYAAVAVEGVLKTDPGSVVFIRTSNLKAVAQVTVGSLPDMVTFSPDGRYVITANEGEPSSDYKVDPEGSVSVIDVSRGVKNVRQSDVRTTGFGTFDKQTLLDAGIRIFGPNATVAQDIEPEYVSVSADSKTAYVTLQENNAIAVVDLATATVTKLLPLGYKDHNRIDAEAEVYSFDPAEMPAIGTTLAGQELNLGGFSGLAFEGIDPVTGYYNFVSHTDRGPNAEPNAAGRPFLLPDFTPEVIRFQLNPQSGDLAIRERIKLQSAPGVPLTGISNLQITGGNGNTKYNDELPVDLLNQPLPLDPLGADLEGIAFAADGSFWMCDEYRPALYHFASNGVMIDRLVPAGTAAAAGLPEGTFGREVLPSVLAQRRQNRGFEALAIDNGKIYAFAQSPVRNPETLTNAQLTAMKNVRLIEFDPATEKTRQFIYVMDNTNLGAAPNTPADKIGDMATFGNGEFLVLERDDDKISTDEAGKVEKKVYRFNLNGATAITNDGLIGETGKTVDQLTTTEMLANGIRPIFKSLHVDLATTAYNDVDKVEGLAIIDPWTVAAVNDNDFGVAQITVAPDGTFTRNYTPEPVTLGIIDVRMQGLDASDQDTKVNIRPWPVKGMYLPDGIASFKVDGQEYLITANEGDAREYIFQNEAGQNVNAFVEALRVSSGSVVLDSALFPNAALLKRAENLGRLNITSTLGRNPENGRYKELYAFGTRSFSIWKPDGTQVFDSGEELERITSGTPNSVFNASNSNNTFDNRSDDKGPEPEAVVTGTVFGRQYAFIGLERIGGIMVYDLTNPTAPKFVEYVNNRDFSVVIGDDLRVAGDLGPEGLILIDASKSPNGKPLLVVANEISGTTTIYEISPGE